MAGSSRGGLPIPICGCRVRYCRIACPNRRLPELVGDEWIHAGVPYSSLRFAGAARLLFGLPRHPWRLSETFQTLTLEGSALLSADTCVASYIVSCDMWRAADRPIWWRSMHVLDAVAFGSEIETLRIFICGPCIRLLQPDTLNSCAPSNCRNTKAERRGNCHARQRADPRTDPVARLQLPSPSRVAA